MARRIPVAASVVARRRGRMKKRWIIVPVAALAALLAGGIAVAATGFGGIRFKVVAPVTVQALGLNTDKADVGQTVTAGAKLVAERESVLPEVAIAVTGPDGKRADFPHANNWKLGTSQKVFRQSKTFDQVGTYTYWFTYKKDGRWIDLKPKQNFTVGSPSTANPAPTTPGATPSPSGSTSTGPTTTPTTPPRPAARPAAARPAVVRPAVVRRAAPRPHDEPRAAWLCGQPGQLRLPDPGHDRRPRGHGVDHVQRQLLRPDRRTGHRKHGDQRLLCRWRRRA